MINIMILAFLIVIGLFFGSFVNALVWRVHEQEKQGKGQRVKGKGGKSLKPQTSNLKPSDLSILKGRSMCPHCRHTLAARDLVPVFSWLLLRGKCRYCKKPIAWQYPAVELVTAALFGLSYVFWPESPVFSLQSSVNFIVWLAMLTGFMALIVYDFRWMLLPNRIIYPLLGLSLLLAAFNVAVAADSLQALWYTALSVGIAGGLFYGLFTLSNGKWIGGGDVKLGFLIGLILGDPYLAFLMLLGASTLGTIIVLPGLLLKKVTPTSRIPFGPFLIISAIFVQLFGASIIEWYKRSLLLGI